MGLLDRFRRKKEDETSRVARLLQTGRIVEGTIECQDNKLTIGPNGKLQAAVRAGVRDGDAAEIQRIHRLRQQRKIERAFAQVA